MHVIVSNVILHLRRNRGNHAKKLTRGDYTYLVIEGFLQWIHRFWWTSCRLLTPIYSKMGPSRAARQTLFVESCFLPFKWPSRFFYECLPGIHVWHNAELLITVPGVCAAAIWVPGRTTWCVQEGRLKVGCLKATGTGYCKGNNHTAWAEEDRTHHLPLSLGVKSICYATN